MPFPFPDTFNCSVSKLRCPDEDNRSTSPSNADWLQGKQTPSILAMRDGTASNTVDGYFAEL